MSERDIRLEIDGYIETRRELDVLKKYGFDYTAQRGRAETLISGIHPKRLRLRVSEIRQETASTKSFRLVSADGRLPPFQAGQYVNLFVEIDGVRTSRPYSIASPPNQTGYYELAVRRVPDGFVSSYLLDEVRVGAELAGSGPAGNFYHHPVFHGRDLVFLAGGSGITPFMSMIRETTDRGLDRRIHLFYGSRIPEDVIYKDELEERAARHDHFRLHTVISEPPPGYTGRTGFLTADLLSDLAAPAGDKTFYLCGPEVMYRFCRAELDKMGVAPRRVRSEGYGPPADVTREPGWPEDVAAEARFTVRVRNGREFEARAGETLLSSLERAGITVPSSCRSGECSLCRIKMISGRVFQPRGARVRKSDRRFGWIHSCLAYPLEDLEILI
ncbi:MAG: 2Fe-2S iron-sulfur cluster binding domain-containing protein [Proteobacteria bacterium]|nr:2Fe-2S iron-sulfur cluster binding domain-containing protein [Pseudomonadota bacterium]